MGVYKAIKNEREDIKSNSNFSNENGTRVVKFWKDLYCED